MSKASRRGTAFVTGANGYIGNAVAKAFRRAGWKTFGLIRRGEDAADLARHEIHPVLGSPSEPGFLSRLTEPGFDVVVSATEDGRDAAGHLRHVRAMLDEMVRRDRSDGAKPLVMFTSGCKDYGEMAEKHGDPKLAPHTEASPLRPPAWLAPRMEFGRALLADQGGTFDATVLRPTIVYGNASSHYGALFDLAANSHGVLRMVGDPDAVMHSLHVDDCADAYVALAEHPTRSAVAGQAFNIANAHYETAREVGEALARSYDLSLEFTAPEAELSKGSVHALANFWQWVGSDKLRALTAWRERKPSFVAGLADYRLAYEARRPDRG